MGFESEKITNNLAFICKEIHLQASQIAEKFDLQLKRKIHNTPKSILDFNKLYQKTYNEKKDEL